MAARFLPRRLQSWLEADFCGDGAAEVATWEVLAGPSRSRLRSIGSVPQEGFETVITVRTAEPLVDVRVKVRPGARCGPGGRAWTEWGCVDPARAHLPLARLISEHSATVLPSSIRGRKKSPIWGMRSGTPEYYNLVHR